tara:strand:+ start:642 stop:899 length:258 start_codon:yes stop_codon:yes gene_type:complete
MESGLGCGEMCRGVCGVWVPVTSPAAFMALHLLDPEGKDATLLWGEDGASFEQERCVAQKDFLDLCDMFGDKRIHFFLCELFFAQ